MNKLFYLPIGAAALVALAACASLGRPQGGPRDADPPRYVGSNPVPGSLNFKGNKISIFFDENVQLDDPNSKVAISPAQKEMPTLFANGRRLDVTLRDSIQPNTTYTIDLADAVKDLNEGNVLDGFAIDFSTGDSIDTLSVSGMVFQARNLEPAQGMLVGVYSGDADSCIETLRFDRIARTNQYGQFTLRNLKARPYQIFALNDMNRDLHWDRTEDVAFYSTTVTPTVEVTTVTDSISPDSTVERTVTTFLPNDLLLSWFNEDYKAQYLKTYKREPRNMLYVEMAAPADSLAQLTVIALGSDSTRRIPLEGKEALLTHTATNDTLKFWLRDSVLIMADTMLVEARYRRVDTLDNIVWTTDTLKFNFRTPKNQPKRLTLEEKIDSVRAKLKNDTAAIDTFALRQPDTFLTFNFGSSVQDINRPLRFSSASPIDSLPAGAMHLEYMPDSVWIKVEPQPDIVAADTFSHTNFMIDTKWISGGKYRIVSDSLAVHDIYGRYNKPIASLFEVRKLDEYSSVRFNITGVPDSVKAMVELLNDSDEPVRMAEVVNGKVEFQYLLPATYFARLFIDADGNGEWTNGDLKLRRQPEEVYYFSKKLSLKRNWDRNEDWDINSIAVDLQKHNDIKQNRPRINPGAIAPEDEGEYEDIDNEDLYGEF